MTWDIATNTKPKARKEYRCQASECINNIMGPGDFTPEELIDWNQAKDEGFKILKGTVYMKTDGIWEGEASVFRARPAMDDICIKYLLYDE